MLAPHRRPGVPESGRRCAAQDRPIGGAMPAAGSPAGAHSGATRDPPGSLPWEPAGSAERRASGASGATKNRATTSEQKKIGV